MQLEDHLHDKAVNPDPGHTCDLISRRSITSDD